MIGVEEFHRTEIPWARRDRRWTTKRYILQKKSRYATHPIQIPKRIVLGLEDRVPLTLSPSRPFPRDKRQHQTRLFFRG